MRFGGGFKNAQGIGVLAADVKKYCGIDAKGTVPLMV
jgi:hypothetical protein